MSAMDMNAIKKRAEWCASDGINVTYRSVARPDADRPPFGFRTASATDEDAYLDRIELIDEVDRLERELMASRAATDRTAIERDQYHGELTQAQAQTIRVALQVPKWQAIETAPKDGTYILGYWGEEENPQEFVTRHGIVYWDGHGWNDEEDNDPIPPTHWQPLPEDRRHERIRRLAP